MGELSPKTIKAVLLDADDTQWNTIGTQWRKHIHVAKKHYGKDLAEDEIRRHYGEPLEEYLRNLYGTTDSEQAVALSMQYRRQFPKELFPWAVPTLLHLKAAGFVIGIITKSTRDGLTDDLRAMDLPPELYDYIQTADESPYQKPDPRALDPALRWLEEEKGILPDEVIYAGDSYDDMFAAGNVHFVGVETGLVDGEGFRKAGTISIPHLGHLIQHLGIGEPSS